MAGTLISAGCSTQGYYGYEATNDGSGYKGFLENLVGRHNSLSVSESDRQRHQRCVFFTLEQLSVGEPCIWHSPTTGARGEVQVMVVYEKYGRMCHEIFTTLFDRGVKRWQDTACYSPVNKNWRWNMSRRY